MPFPPISARTGELVQAIWTGNKFPGSEDLRVSLIGDVAKTNEAAAIPLLLDLLFQSHRIAVAASDCLHQLVSAIVPEDLPHLGDVMRASPYWAAKRTWDNLQPKDVARVPKTLESRVSLLGLASCHRSGYVREIAVRLLGEIDSGAEIPFLLLSLNDWVPVVRSAAQAAIQQRLIADRRNEFFNSIVLVLRLIHCQRSSDDVVQWVIDQLLDPGQEASLVNIISGASPSTRRTCFRLCLQWSGAQGRRVALAGLGNSDVVIQLWSASYIRNSGSRADLEAILTNLEKNRSMPVRREALLARVEREPEQADRYLKAALFDRSASMRELARFHLRKREPVDFAAAYRAAIQEERDTAIALTGLGETGSEGDLPLVRRFVRSLPSKVRSAAIRALGILGSDNVQDELLDLLPDESAKVTRAARLGIRGNLPIDPDRLWNLITDDTRQHVKFAALDLLDAAGSWPALPYLIRLTLVADATIVQQATDRAARRINRVFTRPSASESKQINQAIVECKSRMQGRFLGELRGWLIGMKILEDS